MTLGPKEQKAAKDIGIDVHSKEDMEYMWIADFAANMELPAAWAEIEDDKGNPAYYNPATKVLTQIHPVLAKYKKMFEKIKKFKERAGTSDKEVEPYCAMILNEVLNRCNRELPPVTPEILDRMALLLGIQTSEEHTLARKLKFSIETFAEDQYDLSIQAHQKADVNAFLHDIHTEQVRIDVLEKPEDVIPCSEIDGEPARVKCEDCKDFFSLEGFGITHATGKRKDHRTIMCEQLTCCIYKDRLATCEVDHNLYCDEAYAMQAMKNSELRNHRKKILGGLSCSEYPGRVAEVLCEECSDLYCMEAFIELHRRGNRAKHVPLRLDENGQLHRAGQLLDPPECAKLIDRARQARDGGPWLAFNNDELNTYWFHLISKKTTTKNPYL